MRWAGGTLPEQVADLFGTTPIASGHVHGGDVSDAYKIRLGNGTTVFAKTGPEPGLCRDEAAGLAWLAETDTVRVPRVLAVRDAPALVHRFLVLEWIEPGRPAPDHDERLGRALAALHRFGCARYGLDHDNHIATLPQPNEAAPTWAEFYATRRLLPLARRAVDAGRFDPARLARFDRLADRLGDLLGPEEGPARLHGDLWAGNAIVDGTGGPVLIDPAVYGGHREVDLAMMALFGGFSPRVTAAYDEVHPRAEGWAERQELHQLHPLLVHTVLFGGSYASSVLRVLQRYT